ncbi:MAG: hypothetical protein NTV22_17330 [bacterium]|nr:hypothetical protein [bacterium]
MNIQHRTLNIERKTGNHRFAVLGRFINHRAARTVGIREEDQCHTIISFVAKTINEEIEAPGMVYCNTATCSALSNNNVIAVAASSSCLRWRLLVPPCGVDVFVANSSFLP